MKLFLNLLFLITTINLVAQESISNFHLKDRQVSWEKNFEFDEPSNNNLMDEFTKQVVIKKVGGDFISLDEILSFKVENDMVDFRKYGGTLSSTITFLNYPINYRVIAEFQKNKYKIKVVNIRATTNESNIGFSTFDLLITRKQRSTFAKGKLLRKSLELLDQYFTDKFSLNTRVD